MALTNAYADSPATGGSKKAEAKKAMPQKKLLSQYRREIDRYERGTSSWREEGEQIETLYLDEDRNQTSMRRFALLWSNIETLKPAVYAKAPVIECSRRYKDKDPVARTAAELIERATNTSFELYGVDETFQAVRDDRLLPGRGTAWVRYEATIEQYEDDEIGATTELSDDPEGDEEPSLSERLASEKVCVDYVHWTDFGHNVAGCWNDVWLVWRRVYKTREECEERFGEEIATKLNYDAKVPGSASGRVNGETSGEGADEFAMIYELWDKRRNLVSWISNGMQDEFLESGEPPIEFTGFFPCPKPCYATKTSRSLIPRPDYIYYRDQAKEINDLTDKIHAMMGWLVIKGFVPGAPSNVADALEEVIRDKGNRELFVQVASWQEFTEKGGVAKLIDWLPVDMVINTIQAAISARNQLIQDVFQITGISDILRGQTDPSETLGAQELKAQTGSRRLKNAKDEVARFCRDIGRLVAEVIAEKFEPETIAEMTGYRYQPPLPPAPALLAPMGGNVVPMPGQAPVMGGAAPAMVPNRGPGMESAADPLQPENGLSMTFDDRVMDLLRNDRLRSFRIDIETDSTGQADENADKQQSMEFLNMTSQFMDRAVTAMTQAPDVAPLMAEMLTFAVRRFRAGRTLEEQIEQTFAGITAKVKAAANQPPQPSPEQIKAKADADAMAQKMLQEKQKHEQELMAGQQKIDADMTIAQAQLAQVNAKTEQQAAEHLFRMAEMERQADLNRQQAAIKSEERQEDRAISMAERAAQAAEPNGKAQ